MTIPRADPLVSEFASAERAERVPAAALPARGIATEKQREGDVTPHADQHKSSGADPIAHSDIGAAPSGHTHPVRREVFIYPSQDAHDAILDDWPHNTAGSANEAAFIWHAPVNFTALDSIIVVMIPDATETIQADIDVSVAAVGEDYNADTRQSPNETLAVTVNDITEWDITAIGTLFDDIGAGDYVAIRFQSDTATLRILGLRVNYEA